MSLVACKQTDCRDDGVVDASGDEGEVRLLLSLPHSSLYEDDGEIKQFLGTRWYIDRKELGAYYNSDFHALIVNDSHEPICFYEATDLYPGPGVVLSVKFQDGSSEQVGFRIKGIRTMGVPAIVKLKPGEAYSIEINDLIEQISPKTGKEEVVE